MGYGNTIGIVLLVIVMVVNLLQRGPTAFSGRRRRHEKRARLITFLQVLLFSILAFITLFLYAIVLASLSLRQSCSALA